MKVLDLDPAALPIVVRLRINEEVKEYVLLKTKQGKLLLNKKIDSIDNRNR
ncbi:MAG: hypothetical protein ACREBW_10530 [Candidatus Micrarchaeaceae archaeon]